MTISRVNAATWGGGDKLTSAQANGLDLNGTYALDKRAGQSDSLASVVSLSGAGRIVYSTATGADADSTINAGGGNTLVRVPTITAPRTYTMGTGVDGDMISIYVESGISAANYIDVSDGTSVVFRLGTATGLATGTAYPVDGYWVDLVYDGTAAKWRVRNGPSLLRAASFTAGGTFVVPAGVSALMLVGCGGGGSGGAGPQGTVASNNRTSGGSAGGGALASTMLIPVNPGDTGTVVIGAGGTGSYPSNGNPGGDTTFTISGFTFTFFGAQGGSIGFQTSSSTGSMNLPGGMPVSGFIPAPQYHAYGVTPTADFTRAVPWGNHTPIPSQGGAADSGLTWGSGYQGGKAPASMVNGGGLGGAAASPGADVGANLGGGGGGGGGAGPFGNGGAGGAGGAGINAAGPGAASTAGGDALSNTGAGGGGGGGGGTANTTGSPGNRGGHGGSGLLYVCWVK